MSSSQNLKEVQRLTNQLVALSRFLGTSTVKPKLFFKLMRKDVDFAWTEECEAAFKYFKNLLSSPLGLAKPKHGKPLFLYLSVSEETLASTLVLEDRDKHQHPIYFVSKTDQPIKKVLQKPDLASRMMSWSIELSQFDIRYEPRSTIKVEVMVRGAGLILTKGDDMVIQTSIKFDFPISNNQVEYEVSFAGLALARDVGAIELTIFSDL
ncbi:uncharacterized protein [Arachis hypogaea]|uniref:uncharacterized protein n=1 Tax=Arachis hypogaea TaxID=3818 RepID=UPI003B20DDE7